MKLGYFGICAALAAASPVGAQQPAGMSYIPEEILDTTLNRDAGVIRFCLNGASMLKEFDREIGQAIADTLLLRAEFYELSSPFNTRPYDYGLDFEDRDLFIQMRNNCDALLGARVNVDSVPEWITVSQAYFDTRLILVGLDEEVSAFNHLPPQARIGFGAFSPGANFLATYVSTLAEAQRPRRIVYPDNGVLIDRLLDKSVDAVFIWNAAICQYVQDEQTDITVFHEIAMPYQPTAVSFGAAYLSDGTYLREMVDEAIDALDQSGELMEIAWAHFDPSCL